MRKATFLAMFFLFIHLNSASAVTPSESSVSGRLRTIITTLSRAQTRERHAMACDITGCVFQLAVPVFGWLAIPATSASSFKGAHTHRVSKDTYAERKHEAQAALRILDDIHRIAGTIFDKPNSKIAIPTRLWPFLSNFNEKGYSPRELILKISTMDAAGMNGLFSGDNNFAGSDINYLGEMEGRLQAILEAKPLPACPESGSCTDDK